MAAAEALDPLKDTVQGLTTIQGLPVMTGIRIALARELTLGGMPSVVSQFREAWTGCAFEIEIDAEHTQRISEGARLLLRDLVLKAQREGIEVRVSGRLDACNRLTLLG